MKNNTRLFIFLAFVLFFCNEAFAQYTKAKVFDSRGKTFGIGSGINFYPKGIKPSPIINISWGKDRGKNRYFHWSDLEFSMPTKYKFSGLTELKDPPYTKVTNTVSGNFIGSLHYRYNFGFHLANNKNEDKKLLPFIKLAIGLNIGEEYPVDEQNYSNPNTIGFRLSSSSKYYGEIGAGLLYRLSSGLGIITTSGYRIKNELKLTDNKPVFRVMPNQIFLNVGLRYSLVNSED
jgi:hypothetical protein